MAFLSTRRETNPLPMTNKEKEERNFISERLSFVKMRCTRLWKLKGGVK